MKLAILNLDKFCSFKARWLIVSLVCVILVQQIQLSETRRPRSQAYRDAQFGLSPVVLLPGDGGNRLEAKLDKTTKSSGCAAKTDWFQIWVNLGQFSPFRINCLIEHMSLVYNQSKKTTGNPAGVKTRVPDFGSTRSVEYLDAFRLVGYFDRIVSRLVKYFGYEKGVNMVAAPYDFRKAPNELANYFKSLAQLIEKTYHNNNNQSVTLICHSMGCLFAQHLLNAKPREWRDRYVRRMISISAPWAGSFKAVTTLLFGDDLGVKILDANRLRRAQITYPSLMYLFPKGREFSSRILVKTQKNTYSLNNIEGLFKEFKLAEPLELFRNAYPQSEALKAPQVELWCLYSYELNTPESVIFSNGNKNHSILYGDGDGTVNLISLESCKAFQQEQPIQTMAFPKVNHIKTLRNSNIIQYIISILERDLQYY